MFSHHLSVQSREVPSATQHPLWAGDDHAAPHGLSLLRVEQVTLSAVDARPAGIVRLLSVAAPGGIGRAGGSVRVAAGGRWPRAEVRLLLQQALHGCGNVGVL